MNNDAMLIKMQDAMLINDFTDFFFSILCCQMLVCFMYLEYDD